MITLALTLLLAQAPPSPSPRSLTLDEALKTAAAQQPTLRQQHAETEVANARTAEEFAPLLPQVNLSAGYERQTGNFAARPGSIPNASTRTAGTSLATFNYFNAGLTATETIWDFGQTWGRYRAAQYTAESQVETEREAAVQVALNVRTTYFTARAQKDLVDVARANLQDQQAHLDQTSGFVQVGTRPEIDLAQSRANVANAKVQLITAQNNYATSKARLNQAMGVEGPTDYEVIDTELGAIHGEDGPLDSLVEQAYHARPESAAYEAEISAQQYIIRSVRGAYWPSFGVNLGANLAGPDPSTLVPNLNGQLTLTWNLYAGGATNAQVREAEAQLAAIEAQRDAFHLQVRVDVQQAQLAVQAAKQTLAAADEALSAARVQLQLAEGRYQAGVGNIIELSDAQAGLTNAAAQRVQAVYTVANARAQLMAALGQP